MAIGPLYLAMCDLAAERGADLSALLARFGLSRAGLADPAVRLSPEVGRALGRELFREARDPAIGLRAAARFQLGDLDLVGYITRHSLSLVDALASFGRYCRLLGDTAECPLERRAGTLEITLSRSGGQSYLPEAADFLAGIIVRLVRELFPGAPPPTEVRLPRAFPRDPGPYRRFFAGPVTFAAPVAAVSYPESAAGLVSGAADARLGELLRQQADARLAALPPAGTLVDRVRSHLAAHLEQGDDAARSAARLRMSERTLRRRLRESGTGYRQLVDAVRRERALALMDAGAHSVTAIAAEVGFADASAFARAFRRWTGRVPRDYLRAVQVARR
jgi:AraC-like DNA-binding protein